MLTLPDAASIGAGGHQNSSTLRPYDPTQAVGDTSPNLPPPSAGDGGCGVAGMIIVVIVAALTQQWYLTEFAAPEAAFTAGTLEGSTMTLTSATTATYGAADLAIGAALGSVASQVVGNVLGIQSGFSFKAVLASALSAGLGAEVDSALGDAGVFGQEFTTANTVARAAIHSVIHQGVNVALGQQKSFSWAQVAASAIAAPLAQGAGAIASDAFGGGGIGAIAGKVAYGITSQVVTHAIAGGKATVAGAVADSFNFTSGRSLVVQSQQAALGQQGDTLMQAAQENFRAEELRLQNQDAYTLAASEQIRDVFSQDYIGNRSPGAQVAAGGVVGGVLYDNGSLVGGTQINLPQVDLFETDRSLPEVTVKANRPAPASRSLPVNEQLANMQAMADAYHASGMSGATGDVSLPNERAYMAGVGYADENNVFPTVTVIAEREAVDASNAGATDAARVTRYGSVSAMGPMDSFFTFNSWGRGVKGLAASGLDAWLAIPRMGVGVSNLARDAIAYAANTIAPERSVLTGQAFDFRPRSGLIQSIQRNGAAGTVGAGITDMVRNLPGIGLVAALGAPSRDWGNVGGQVFNTGTAGGTGVFGRLSGLKEGSRIRFSKSLLDKAFDPIPFDQRVLDQFVRTEPALSNVRLSARPKISADLPGDAIGRSRLVYERETNEFSKVSEIGPGAFRSRNSLVRVVAHEETHLRFGDKLNRGSERFSRIDSLGLEENYVLKVEERFLRMQSRKWE